MVGPAQAVDVSGPDELQADTRLDAGARRQGQVLGVLGGSHRVGRVTDGHLLAASARGVHRPLLVLPTGTGKTIVFALLVQRRRGRSLILAHRDELIQQAVDKLHLVDPTLPLGVVQAARDEHTAPTVVASVQTLSRRTRLTRLAPDFQTIVIDEAHHAPAPTYRRILEYCRAWHPEGPLVVGVTATPERGDRHSLRQVFDGIVYQKTLLDLREGTCDETSFGGCVDSLFCRS